MFLWYHSSVSIMKKELTTAKNNANNAEIRLKRLQYQSWHRGCKETDLILGWFADEKLGKMSEQQLDIYEKFLNENDTDIWDWLVKKEVPNNSDYAEILQELEKFAGKK